MKNNITNMSIPRIIFSSLILSIVAIGYYYSSFRKGDQIQATSRTLQQEIANINPNNTETKYITEEQANQIVKEFIIRNPEIIAASMEEMQKRRLQQMEQKVQELVKGKMKDIENINPETPYLGSSKADVTMTLFLDYNCGYCRETVEAINKVLDSDAGFKVIFKPYPILQGNSEQIARIILSFYQLNPTNFASFQGELVMLPNIGQDQIKTLLNKYSVSFEKISELMYLDNISKELELSSQLAGFLHINAIPTAIINGNLHQGAMDINRIKSIIMKIREVPKQ